MATRLTAWYASASAAILLAVAVALYLALSASLEREDDEYLEDQIAILSGILRERPMDEAALRQEVEWESLLRSHAKSYVRLVDATGRVIGETPGMPGELCAAAFPDPGDDRSPGLDLRGPSGTPYRVMSARARVGAGGTEARMVQVALDQTAEDRVLGGFRLVTLPVLVAGVVLSGLVGRRIARRGLRPLGQISEAAGRVRSTTLSERLSPSGWPAELSELASTFNEMLERLEESFGRISRFSADLAHELRTPIHNLRGEAEVALSRARSPEVYRESLESCVEECERLSRIIDSLLFLARAERPAGPLRLESVDVARELILIREFYEPVATEGGVEIAVEVPGSLPVVLDRTFLQRAVGNLVENALAHTPRGGRIVLRAGVEGGAVRLDVADTGCGIPAEHLPRVFDRLYRVDSSRTASTGGAGLGLSIVKTIAELHGGRASIESREGEGTRVTLLLPLAPRGASGDGSTRRGEITEP